MVQRIPFVEPFDTLFLEDFLDDISRTVVTCVGIVGLETRSDNLVGVCYTAGEHLADSAEQQKIKVGQAVPTTAARTPMILELFVRHELDRTVADAEQRWDEATVESPKSFCLPQVRRALTNGFVSAWCIARRRKHACLDHPDGVCEEGSEYARRSRG